MHPQVFLFAQIGQNRIGNAAVTDLNGIAVLDQAGDVFADPVGDVIGHGGFEFQQ